jgi:hypothetical protein
LYLQNVAGQIKDHAYERLMVGEGSQGSWRRHRNDGGHVLKEIRQKRGDVVHVPDGLRIVYSDGVEQRKSTIRMRLVWKMREDRAMEPDDQRNMKDKWG